MKIKVVLEPSEEGGYTAHVPSLPGQWRRKPRTGSQEHPRGYRVISWAGRGRL